ncbi:MAG TPA: fibrillarin-like rRNA/tRNA 2'-O-methyltransferase [Thermoplasmata archaeon]|nr:fibrillarin-like rRNA/tRNA 2'-O-methyltransferase [Thermoplasmata archaeon]
MRTARRFETERDSPRLVRRRSDDRIELWTETVGELPPAYGEGWMERDGRAFRRFEPARSKLSAGIVAGWTGPLPRPDERWLYLGAASGTTATHVADLVGPGGRVYAVERSLRPFARLLATSARWPNLLPILGDARAPEGYADLVPEVDGLYADIAQPDQVDIVRANAALLLGGDGAAIVVALKTASMGREQSAVRHRDSAETRLADGVDLVPGVRLEPFHRGHYLIGGTVRSAGARPPRPVSRPRAMSRGPRRR